MKPTMWFTAGAAATVAALWWLTRPPKVTLPDPEDDAVELEVELRGRLLGHVHARALDYGDYCRACGTANPRPGEACPDQRRARALVLDGARAYPVDDPVSA